MKNLVKKLKTSQSPKIDIQKQIYKNRYTFISRPKNIENIMEFFHQFIFQFYILLAAQIIIN